MAEHQERKIGFRSVQLFKDQTLGIGSYGAVCKAKCDDLLCAAKILHPTLFDPTAQLQVSSKQEHRLPIRRFEQECEFLSTIRHPNIVQYLCMHQDPDTGLPVLLMELMDDSLTHFLESSLQPIPYHIQVNVCHDITLALSFLHSNGIVHRDLSSNNVLLRGNILAKVTDFGMAKLGDLNPQATRYTFTMCPGTDVYMPPEAVQDEPVYTEKIDCFSFGVIIVQTSTRQFPKPGNRRQELEINHPGLPQGTVEVRLAEVDRRQNHISQVDPNHPLLPISLDCLKDKDSERPSAQQLCERVASLKERSEYSDSMAAAQQERQQPQQREIEEKERQLGQLREQLQQLQQLHREQTQQIVRVKEREVVQLRQQLQESQQLHRGTQETVTEMERELGQTKRELETVTEKERETGWRQQQVEIHKWERANVEKQLLEKDRQLYELEGQLLLRSKDKNHQGAARKVDRKENIKLACREGKKAPFAYERFCDAVVDGSKVYFRGSGCRLFSYNISDNSWLQLLDCPFGRCSLAIINGQLTTIGGEPFTNKLMSLTDEYKWTEKFPPMPTKRTHVTAVCTGTVLIVIGGIGERGALATVEVLNFETSRWSTAVDLPEPLYYCSASVRGDQLYMLGGDVGDKSVYTCSVSALLQTCTQRSLVRTFRRALSLSSSSSGVWSEFPDLPVSESTCVTFCGQLLAVGGEDSDSKPTTAVYVYNQATNSWDVISHMITARRACFATVLPNNQLMVVGGLTMLNDKWIDSDSVEFSSLI